MTLTDETTQLDAGAQNGVAETANAPEVQGDFSLYDAFDRIREAGQDGANDARTQITEYVDSLRAGLDYHVRRWERAHDTLESILGGNLFAHYLAGEVIERGQVAEALYDSIKAIDIEKGAFTVQFDVDTANIARKKDGSWLVVKLSTPWTSESRDVSGKLGDLSLVGGTYVTFTPAYTATPQWVQPRLTPVDEGEHVDSRPPLADEEVAESDTSKDAAEAAGPEAPEGEKVDAGPTPMRGRGRGRRGAEPVAPDPDSRGV